MIALSGVTGYNIRVVDIIVTIHSRIAHLLRDYDPNIPSEMGFAHRRRRFSLAKPVTITARRAVNSNT